MIRIAFFSSDERLTGFSITGHSGYAEAGSDIVCAAVSSAAYMTVNTVTDVLGLSPAVEADDDGAMLLRFGTMSEADRAADILDGFRLHIEGLREQYPDYLTVTITEV